MRKQERIAARIALFILRLGLPMIPAILLYTCCYIYHYAPDGGTLTAFKQTVAELLNHATVSVALLAGASAIPGVRLL